VLRPHNVPDRVSLPEFGWLSSGFRGIYQVYSANSGVQVFDKAAANEEIDVCKTIPIGLCGRHKIYSLNYSRGATAYSDLCKCTNNESGNAIGLQLC
jgi:hypothetical protein